MSRLGEELQQQGSSNLSTAPTVVLPAYDGEGSLAGDAGVAGVVGDPVGRVCREREEKTRSRTVTGQTLALREEEERADSYAQCGGVCGSADLRTVPPGLWLPALMMK